MTDTQQTPKYDIAVIGGGINGTGIARDAAGRGYKVLLVEKDDLASHTSSASSKLIHGGLRYLEYYEFKLVREALKEREVLLNIAPHIIWPLDFVLPHNKQMRPGWMIRCGLWLYDHLASRKKLPASRAINFRHHPSGEPLKKNYKKGFTYADCWAQDSRLVVLNAIDARNHGADIFTRTQCVDAKPVDDVWQLSLKTASDQTRQVEAKMLVNASGPWVAEFLDTKTSITHDHSIRLVSGGHIVVPRLYDHDQAYILQNDDNRIVFAIPYEDKYTLIGTTENVVNACEGSVISDEEIEYLCESVNHYFDKQISKDDVVWHFSGIRPLLEDGSDDATSATREYVLDLHEKPVPCLSVFGGKITTFRSLAESAANKIDENFGKTPAPWTASKPLPGGDMPDADFNKYLSGFSSERSWLPPATARHYVRNYGTKAVEICQTASKLDDLGQDFGGGLYQAEIDYLIKNEWAKSIEDILWRRSKWGLKLDRNQCANLQSYLDGEKV